MEIFEYLLWINPVICFIGIIANILVMAVGLKEKLRKLSFTVHLLTLSISDLGYLVSSSFMTFSMLLHVQWPIGLCPMLHWFDISLRLVSSWTIVWITVERALGICYPLKAKRLCTRSKAMIISFITILISFSTMSYPLYLNMWKRQTFTECTNWHYDIAVEDMVKMKGENFYMLKYMIGLLFYSFFPAMAISAANVSICVIIRKRHEIPLWRYVQRNIRTGESHRIIGMLLINVIAFAVLTLPNELLGLYQINYQEQLATNGPTFDLLVTLTFVMLSIHHSLNPIIYSLAGSMYREELHKLCCTNPCDPASRRASYSNILSGLSAAHTMGEKTRDVRKSSCYLEEGGFSRTDPLRTTLVPAEYVEGEIIEGNIPKISDIAILL